MSGARQSGTLVARIAAMDEYIAALLDDARRDRLGESTPDSSDPARQPEVPRYRAFVAAGMPCLLPQAVVADCLLLPAQLSTVDSGPAWWMGTLRQAGADIRVVDLARVIAPGLRCARPGHGLRLAGRPWMLAVSAVGALHEMDDALFALRSERGSRPWLAGMTRDTPRALLDVDALIAVLQGDLQA